ncbi:Uncharacterised protein [Vibrio cholerae]|nr:Uncharacterised protein [Vibrio cholerae]
MHSFINWGARGSQNADHSKGQVIVAAKADITDAMGDDNLAADLVAKRLGDIGANHGFK